MASSTTVRARLLVGLDAVGAEVHKEQAMTDRIIWESAADLNTRLRVVRLADAGEGHEALLVERGEKDSQGVRAWLETDDPDDRAEATCLALCRLDELVELRRQRDARELSDLSNELGAALGGKEMSDNARAQLETGAYAEARRCGALAEALGCEGTTWAELLAIVKATVTRRDQAIAQLEAQLLTVDQTLALARVLGCEREQVGTARLGDAMLARARRLEALVVKRDRPLRALCIDCQNVFNVTQNRCEHCEAKTDARKPTTSTKEAGAHALSDPEARLQHEAQARELGKLVGRVDEIVRIDAAERDALAQRIKKLERADAEWEPMLDRRDAMISDRLDALARTAREADLGISKRLDDLVKQVDALERAHLARATSHDLTSDAVTRLVSKVDVLDGFCNGLRSRCGAIEQEARQHTRHATELADVQTAALAAMGDRVAELEAAPRGVRVTRVVASPVVIDESEEAPLDLATLRVPCAEDPATDYAHIDGPYLDVRNVDRQGTLALTVPSARLLARALTQWADDQEGKGS